MTKIVTVSEIASKIQTTDGTAKGYVIALMIESKKAQIQRFIPRLQWLMADKFLRTNDVRYYEALTHLRFVESLVKSYNDKALVRYHGYFRDLLRGYRIL